MATIRKIDRFTDAVLSATDRLRPHRHTCPQCSVRLTCNNPTGCPGEYALALCGACVPARSINAAAERQYIAAEQSELSAADRASYHELMEHDRWLGTVCGVCGDPLRDDGSCTRCESEAADERCNDL